MCNCFERVAFMKKKNQSHISEKVSISKLNQDKQIYKIQDKDKKNILKLYSTDLIKIQTCHAKIYITCNILYSTQFDSNSVLFKYPEHEKYFLTFPGIAQLSTKVFKVSISF